MKKKVMKKVRKPANKDFVWYVLRYCFWLMIILWAMSYGPYYTGAVPDKGDDTFINNLTLDQLRYTLIAVFLLTMHVTLLALINLIFAITHLKKHERKTFPILTIIISAYIYIESMLFWADFFARLYMA